jgi:hypothetical protein
MLKSVFYQFISGLCPTCNYLVLAEMSIYRKLAHEGRFLLSYESFSLVF